MRSSRHPRGSGSEVHEPFPDGQMADIRVKVRPTGESADLALFEFKEGVIEASEKGEFPE